MTVVLEAPLPCRHCGQEVEPTRWWPDNTGEGVEVEYHHCGDSWTVPMVLQRPDGPDE